MTFKINLTGSENNNNNNKKRNGMLDIFHFNTSACKLHSVSPCAQQIETNESLYQANNRSTIYRRIFSIIVQQKESQQTATTTTTTKTTSK